MVVQCTWKTADGRDVANAITWTTKDEEKNNVDVEDEVQAENCLLLLAPSSGSPEYPTVPACQLLLSCQAPSQIKCFSVLSEARVLEIYGHHGEYIKTIRNELLEEVDDMAVFRGDVVLERPLNVCSIKFACLQSKNEMWLYGVKVTIIQSAERSPASPTAILYADVEQRLKAMGLSLSDNAEAFKQILKCQPKNLLEFGDKDIASFIELLKMSNLVKDRSQNQMLHDDVQTVVAQTSQQNGLSQPMPNEQQSDLLSHPGRSPLTIAKTENFISQKPTSLQSSSTQTDDFPPNALEIMMNHVNEKMQDLDVKLWEKIDKRFQEIEAKLLCKLDEIESFVKPQGILPKS